MTRTPPIPVGGAPISADDCRNRATSSMTMSIKQHTALTLRSLPLHAGQNGGLDDQAKRYLLAFTLIASFASSTAPAETPDEWIKLGTRIHGFFGSYLVVGIRIGLDALARLHAQRRGVTVVYYSGPKSPCPCPADGIAIATVASVGQGTLQLSPEKAPADAMGVAVIRSKATGAGLKYTIPASWLPRLDEINKDGYALGRFNAVMNAPGLFTAETLPTDAPKK